MAIGWNRTGEAIEKENFIFFNRKAKYGMRYLNVINKLMWFIFIFKYLIKNKNKYDLIHACDFDTAFPASLASLITKKKIIFDVFDWMSGENSNNIFDKIIGILERWTARKANYLIVCEEERKEQIPIENINKTLVMPNIPFFSMLDDLDIYKKIQKQREKGKFIISYVGVFDRNRGIEDFLEVVSKNENIFFNIAGFGGLESHIRKYIQTFENIKYWGKVDYNTGLNLMKNSDFILAMYYHSNPVHRYAAPNKFYEGLMLKVPIITTINTLVGNKTEKYNTGFAIEEGKISLQKLFEKKEILKEFNDKKINCEETWNKYYKNAISLFMKNEYLKIVNNHHLI